MIAELLTELALKFEKEGLALPAKIYLHKMEYDRLSEEVRSQLRYISPDHVGDQIEIRTGSGAIIVRKEP